MEKITIKMTQQHLNVKQYLMDVRCPKCLGIFEPFLDGIKCIRCDFVSIKQGAVQVLCNELPTKNTEQPFMIKTTKQWQQNIRNRYKEKSYRAWLNEVVGVSNIAIKLFVRPLSGLTVLNLGCGSGLLTQDIAKHAKAVYAVEQDIPSLQLAQRRHQIFNPSDNIHLIATGNNPYLPFSDNTFDVIFLSEQWVNYAAALFSDNILSNFSDNKLSCLLAEIARILKANGQLHFSGKNKYSYYDLSGQKDEQGEPKGGSFLPHIIKGLFDKTINDLSYRKYIKNFQQSNLYVENINHYNQWGNLLLSVKPTSNAMFKIEATQSSNSIKQKIKKNIQENDYFAPGFSFVCTKHHQPNYQSLFDVILYKIQMQLSYISPLTPKISALNITGKHKAVLVLKYNDCSYILKLPFEKSGIEGEKHNALLLSRLSHIDVLSLDYPQAMIQGSVDGQCYFVESLCAGESLQQALPQYGRDHFAGEIYKAWKLLVDYRSASKINNENINLYDFMIIEAATKIRNVTIYPEKLDRLAEFMKQKLTQFTVRGGLFHGDFSVSNLFTQKGKVNGLIDWEMGSFSGPVILDLINIYTSIDRLVNNTDIINNIESLLLNKWPNKIEWKFLQQGFEYCQITPDQQQVLIISLWFWMMTQQLDSDFVYNTFAINKRVDNFLLVIESLIY